MKIAMEEKETEYIIDLRDRKKEMCYSCSIFNTIVTEENFSECIRLASYGKLIQN